MTSPELPFSVSVKFNLGIKCWESSIGHSSLRANTPPFKIVEYDKARGTKLDDGRHYNRPSRAMPEEIEVELYEYTHDEDMLGEVPNEEQVIEEVLGENPRARDLRLMRNALEYRRDMFLREFERSKESMERNTLQARIAELDRQIVAIRQEEEITTFVEGSVRVSLRNSTLREPADEFDE